MREWLDTLMMNGRYHFTTQDALNRVGPSLPAVRAALRRKMGQKEIVMPFKGFWVIVPAEFRRLGCLPAQEFIPQLMGHLQESYYAGLLSAAQYHGAAHQQPQVFQVIVEKNRPEINCGSVRVEFIARKKMKQVPVTNLNTLRGYIRVSTVEATALEIVGYMERCGGIDNAATAVAGLAEKVNIRRAVEVSAVSPKSWTQRLGFLLNQLSTMDTGPLEEFIEKNVSAFVPLVPSLPVVGSQRNNKWKLFINAKVEPDL